jgi:hypothetical protein
MDRRYTLIQLLTIITSFGVVAGLIRIAAVGPRPLAGLAAWLAICVGLSAFGWWSLGVWPWDKGISR